MILHAIFERIRPTKSAASLKQVFPQMIGVGLTAAAGGPRARHLPIEVRGVFVFVFIICVLFFFCSGGGDGWGYSFFHFLKFRPRGKTPCGICRRRGDLPSPSCVFRRSATAHTFSLHIHCVVSRVFLCVFIVYVFVC